MRKIGFALPGCVAAAALLAAPAYDPALFGSLTWRSIGPPRGGRSIASAGSSSRPLEYYFGATGGGLARSPQRYFFSGVPAFDLGAAAGADLVFQNAGSA